MTLTRLFAGGCQYFTQSLAVEASYRFALLQQVAGAVVGLIGLIFFWRTAASSIAVGGNYSPGILSAYLFIAYVVPLIHDNRISAAISSSIRFGKLSFSLLRPFPYLLAVAIQAIATSVLRVGLLAPVFIGSSFFFAELRQIVTNMDSYAFVGFAAAMGVGILCNVLVRMVFGLFAFDLTQTWGPELVLLAFLTLAGGETYPLDLLPQPWFEAASWTPAFYMAGFPALVLLGRLTPEHSLELLGRGLLVATLTLIIVLAMWRRGLRRYEAVGA